MYWSYYRSMIRLFFVISIAYLLCQVVNCDPTQEKEKAKEKSTHWLVNIPPEFRHRSYTLGQLQNITLDSSNKTFLADLSDSLLQTIDAYTDGEVVDAMEHFFWGKINGLALELGALDGSPSTRSMTHALEQSLGWKRILVEGDPKYRKRLKKESPDAFIVNAAICEHNEVVHYSQTDYVGGILEFMAESFVRDFHKDVYAALPGGNFSQLKAVDWSKLEGVVQLDCIPLSLVFHKAKVRHINFFILDVEGGELSVLKSINWSLIKFDVICVETEPQNRPKGYSEKVDQFLIDRGYRRATWQQGRNRWFFGRDFQPFERPGLDRYCYNGVRKMRDRKNPNFQRCAMNISSLS